MGIVNLIMGLVAAVLIATGIKKEEPVNPEEKKNQSRNFRTTQSCRKNIRL